MKTLRLNMMATTDQGAIILPASWRTIASDILRDVGAFTALAGDGISKKLLSEEPFKHDPDNMVLRKEVWTIKFDPSNPVTVEVVYTKDGSYVGEPKVAKYLAEKGIVPEISKPSHSVCSIGRSTKDGKWYGWSHRCMVGFGLGDMVFEEDCPGCDGNTLFVEHGRRPIENDEDAREAARNFAEYVS